MGGKLLYLCALGLGLACGGLLAREPAPRTDGERIAELRRTRDGLLAEAHAAPGFPSPSLLEHNRTPNAAALLAANLSRSGPALLGIVQPRDRSHYQGEWRVVLDCKGQGRAADCSVCTTHHLENSPDGVTHGADGGLKNALVSEEGRLWVQGPSWEALGNAFLPFYGEIFELPLRARDHETRLFGYDLDERRWKEQGAIQWTSVPKPEGLCF